MLLRHLHRSTEMFFRKTWVRLFERGVLNWSFLGVGEVATFHDDENLQPFGKSIRLGFLNATNEEVRRACRPFARDQSETLPASFA
jgi:hypothetical protein